MSFSVLRIMLICDLAESHLCSVVLSKSDFCIPKSRQRSLRLPRAAGYSHFLANP